MKLKLLNIENFIKTRDIKQVKNTKIYATGNRFKMDPGGLFSEEIFGRLGSRQRLTRFGYIDLKTTLIHPEAFQLISSINSDFSKIILDKGRYIISNDGNIIEDENGDTGLFFLIKNFKKINFKKIKSEKQDVIKFIEENKDKILINKFLVMPAGMRDIQVSVKSGKTMHQFSEITALYEKLIRQTNNIIDDSFADISDLMGSIVSKMQRTLLEINNWLSDKLKGKYGIIRGGLLKKVLDFSARLVITPDPNLKFGFVGLPWQIYIRLIEPFSIHELLKKDDIKTKIYEFLSVDKNRRQSEVELLRKFIGYAAKSPNSIPDNIKYDVIEILKEIAKDKPIIYKRDPVENRDSYISAYVRVDDTGYSMKTNPFDLCRNGGDHDGDAVSVFALLTEDSINQAKKELNPLHSKTVWYRGDSPNISISFTLDSSTAIYAATKK